MDYLSIVCGIPWGQTTYIYVAMDSARLNTATMKFLGLPVTWRRTMKMTGDLIVAIVVFSSRTKWFSSMFSLKYMARSRS